MASLNLSLAEDDGEDAEDYCWTPLQTAAKEGDLAAVRAILNPPAQGAAPSAPGDGSEASSDSTPAPAIGARITDIVNAPPVGYYGRTALQAASEAGHEAVVSLLLSSGATVDAPGGHNSGRTALQLACLTTSTAEVPNLQRSYASEQDLRDYQSARHRVVDALLVAGADVNTPASRYSGRTALQAAAEAGDVRLVEKLLGLGAHVDAPPSPTLGLTALQAASAMGHLDVVRVLLGAGANVNAPAARYRGHTALQGACLYGGASTELVDTLLEAGADPDLGGSKFQGGYALHAAVESGSVEIVRRLLAAGARVDVTARGLPGQTPLQGAMLLPDEERAAMEGMLLQAGAVPVEGAMRPSLLFCTSPRSSRRADT